MSDTEVKVGDTAVVTVSDVNLTHEDKSAETTPAQNGNIVTPPETDGISCKLAPAENYTSIDKDQAVKIRFSSDPSTLAGSPAISMIEYVTRYCNRYENRKALCVERESKWISWTYKEYLQDVKTVAKGFIKLGLEPYNGVGILGFNSPEWAFSDLGAIFAGGLATGIYTTNNPEACQYVCSDASCNIVVVENDVQLQKILQVWDQLPKLKAVVQYMGELTDKRPNVYSWNELMEMGRNETEEVLQERMNNQAPNKCCTLIYTSGTTGNPKGVMLSHDNVIMAAESVAVFMRGGGVDVDDQIEKRVVSYLPLSHIAAQITDLILPIRGGVIVTFARPDALKGSLVETLKIARPTLFVGVPRVYEKMEEKLKGVGANITGMKKKLSVWAKGVALHGNRNKEQGKSVPFGWTVANILLAKAHKGLGLDATKMLFTAAAPISKQTCEYFQSLNLPLNEVYGMSESGGMLCMCTPNIARITSIGQVGTINEAKVANPDEDGSGELCFRGRNIFMGYLNNAEKTNEAIDEEGWIHTGDVGKADDDGYYYITGRIKELIITAGGENIAPVPIEDNIKEQLPLIATAMVIGDKKKFLSVLLTLQVEVDINTGLSTDKLLPIAVNYLKSLGIDATKAQEIAPNVPEALQKAIEEGINKANKKAVSNAARVQKFKLLPLEFTVTGGELGPTQKLRRPHVMKMYKESIDEFYA